MFKRFLIFSLLTLTMLTARAQQGLPFLQNYSPEVYNGEPQNWQIAQDNYGLMYFANNAGLVQFDGIRWNLIKLPRIVCRSVDAHEDGRIFVGSLSDLGYVAPDERGKLIYTSLLDKIPVAFRDFVDVWRTTVTKDGVYFKTNRYVFLWDYEKFTVWTAPKSFAFAFAVGNDFYVKEDSLGLILFRNKEMKIMPYSSFFIDKDIRSIVSFENKSLLISTLDDGMFTITHDSKQVTPFKTQADQLIQSGLLFYGCRIDNDRIAFGTFRSGVVIMKNDGTIDQHINEQSGLLDNSVRAMLTDRENGLWLALNNGITRLEINSPITVFDKRLNIKGSVNQIVRYKGQLFIGTSVGLNVQSKNAETFEPIKNFADQVWCFYPTSTGLLIGTNNSTFVFNENKVQLINNSGGTFTFLQSKVNPDRIFVGLRDGLQSLYRKNNAWVLEKTYEGINGQIRSLAEAEDGSLWAVSNMLNVLHISDYKSNQYKIFSDAEGIPADFRGRIIKINKSIYAVTSSNMLQYDTVTQKFIKTPIITDTDGKFNDVANITEAPNGKCYLWTNAKINLLAKEGSSFVVTNLFRRIKDNAINYVYPDGDSLLWVGSSNRLYRVNLKNNFKPLDHYQTIISKLININADSVIICGSKDQIELPYGINNVRFEFSAPVYDELSATEYQTYLENEDSDWSLWTSSNTKDYTNLWEGNYIFKVKSRNIYGVVGYEANLSITILPPWYRTNNAYVLYFLGSCLLLYLGARVYSTELKKKNKRLSEVVDRRTQEINTQKEEITAQRDHILEKNKLLEEQNIQIETQKQNIQLQNQNLIEAQRTIEKQNAELLRVNHALEQIVDERTKELLRSNTELIAVNKELDTFVYRAAHDLRGPIATVMGLCQLGLIEIKDSSAVDYLSKIQMTAERMNSLLFMLLKINNIKLAEIKITSIDLKSLIQEVWYSMGNDFSRRKVNLSVQVDPSIFCESDRMLLIIVLENLISNAVKFCKPDIDARVLLEAKKEGDKIVIIISDNGIGINQNFGDRIFDMFFVGNLESKGFGLGLYAVTMALRKLHGNIKLIPATNGFVTSFEVEIPEKLTI